MERTKVESTLRKLEEIFPGKRVKVERVLIEHCATDEAFARGQDWRLMLHVPSTNADYGAFGHWLSFTGSTLRVALKYARDYAEKQPIERKASGESQQRSAVSNAVASEL